MGLGPSESYGRWWPSSVCWMNVSVRPAMRPRNVSSRCHSPSSAGTGSRINSRKTAIRLSTANSGSSVPGTLMSTRVPSPRYHDHPASPGSAVWGIAGRRNPVVAAAGGSLDTLADCSVLAAANVWVTADAGGDGTRADAGIGAAALAEDSDRVPQIPQKASSWRIGAWQLAHTKAIVPPLDPASGLPTLGHTFSMHSIAGEK